MVRSTPPTWTANPGRHAASGAAADGKLVVRLWQRGPDDIHFSVRDWHSPGAGLCALGGRGMEQLANPESPDHAGMVHSRLARLGIEFHAGHRDHSYGAGLSLWRLQISARAYVDSRRF